MSIRSSIAGLSVALLLGVPAARALDPSTRITQYRHSAWRVQEGAFESAPSEITQTVDGYLWIGTRSGLVRYDGFRFTPWTPPAGQNLPGSAVYSLLSSRDGTLWIGTAAGLLSWKNNRLQQHLRGRFNSILEDHKGRIWAARSRVPDSDGGLCLASGGHPGCIGGDERMRLPYAGPLATDAHGDIWVGASDQLVRWSDESFDTYFRTQLKPQKGLTGVESIAAAPDGSVWVAIPIHGLGLYRFVGGRPQKNAFRGIDTDRITSLFIDREGSLWIGTSRDGIYRIYGDRVDHFRSEDGLSSNDVNSFFEDREGNLWLATSKGLDRFGDNGVLSFSVAEGLAADLASSVVAGSDGAVWIGNRGSLDVLHAEKIDSIRIPGRRVTSLWEDHAKRLWVGIDNLLSIYTRGQFTKINRPDGRPLGTAIAITEDREQNVWVSVVGAENRLFRIRELHVQEEFTPDQIPTARLLAADPAGGIWIGFAKGSLGHYRDGKLEIFPAQQDGTALSGLTIDPDGSAWASTASGIVHWKNRQMKTLNSRNGLPCDTIFSAIRDNNTTLWLYSKCGLIGIPDSELKQWWEQPDRKIKFDLLDVLDGAMPGLTTFQPALSKSPDGRLWFVNDVVVQTIAPGGLRKNRIPPPVYVEGVRADRKEYGTGGRVRLPPRSRDIEISYTALSFSVPEKLRFRYKLNGRDHEWQDAGTRREAFYNDLAPGQYRFEVTASNDSDIWNEGASVNFSIDPAYYQTRWFEAGCVAIFLAILWAGYRYRLRQIAHEFNVRLEERVGERTRIARDLHDTLLQSFQGLMLRLQVVDDLLPQGKAKDQLEQTLQRGDQAIAEGRSAVYDLRSSARITNDLAQAVKALGEELATGDSAAFRMVVEGPARDLHPIIRDEFYRIAREALRNAFSHARAQHIETEITYGEGTFRLRIRDDGEGLPSGILEEGRPGHYGLLGMRERAREIGGKLEIWSSARSGTEIDLSIAGSIAYGAVTDRRLFRLFRKKAG